MSHIVFTPRPTGRKATHKNGKRQAYQATKQNFRLSVDLHMLLKHTSKKTGIPVGSIICAILEDFYKSEQGQSFVQSMESTDEK